MASSPPTDSTISSSVASSCSSSSSAALAPFSVLGLGAMVIRGVAMRLLAGKRVAVFAGQILRRCEQVECYVRLRLVLARLIDPRTTHAIAVAAAAGVAMTRAAAVGALV